MPLTRYFLWVGGVLLALLLIADSYLPKLPDAEKARVDPPSIRIQSDQKWPERIVYDTKHEMIVAAPPAREQHDIARSAALAKVSATTRGAYAEASPSDAGKIQSVDQKKADEKHAKRKVARRRAPVLVVERRPQFGWYGPTYW